ncbi:MAG: SPASM domain-containing protein, partial [Myxococcales bacterium]|nr:SPASM domain-containing protein [Myxococcales bacterium]
SLATAREGELIPIEKLGFRSPTMREAARPVAPATPAKKQAIDWPTAPSKSMVRRIKERNYARFELSQIERSEVALNTPLEIFLASSDACNLSCQFCAITVKEPRPVGSTAIMKSEVMGAVAPWLAGAANVSLTGFGEPFMNPNLLGAVCAGIDHGSRVEFFTNGKMLTEERANKIIEAGLPNLFVSISSADPATYERLYADGDFERLRRNLSHLRDEKARLGLSLPRVIFNTLVMKSTLAGLPDLVRFAAEMNVGKIDLKPLVTYEAIPFLHGERINYLPERDDAILAEVRRLAADAGIELGDINYLATQETREVAAPKPSTGRDWQEPRLRLHKPCPLVWRTTYVGVQGDVKPCCFAADDKHLSLGNLREQTIHDIWNGEKYRELRRQHLAGEVPETCAHCVKFQLYPKSDDTHLWLGERGIEAYSHAKLDRGLDEIAAQHDAFLRHIGAWSRAEKGSADLAALVPAYKALVEMLKSLGALESELGTAKAHLGGLDGSIEGLVRLRARIARASLTWGENAKAGDAAAVAKSLQDEVLPAIGRWKTVAGTIRAALVDGYAAIARRQWTPADLIEMKQAKSQSWVPGPARKSRKRFEPDRLRAELETTSTTLLEVVVERLAAWSNAEVVEAEGFRPVLTATTDARRGIGRIVEQLEAAEAGRGGFAEILDAFGAFHRHVTQSCFELTSATNAGDIEGIATALQRTLLSHLGEWPELERRAWDALDGGSETEAADAGEASADIEIVASVAGVHSPEETGTRFGGLWTDRRDFDSVLRLRREQGACDSVEADLLRSFHRDGCVAIPGAVDEATIDGLNARVDALWRQGHPELKLDVLGAYHAMAPEWRRKRAKLLDLYVHEEAARRALFAPRVQRFLALMFERDPLLFQSLSFEYGTEQAMHQDTAYVVVSSPMEMAAVWIALEDIRAGSGELEYYPGSHRLPETLFGAGRKHWDPSRDGDGPHRAYLEGLPAAAERMGLKRERFLARKGDALIWAADLANGGGRVVHPGATCRALMGHFCPVGVEPNYYRYLPTHRVRALYQPGCWFSSAQYRVSTASEDHPAIAVGG